MKTIYFFVLILFSIQLMAQINKVDYHVSNNKIGNSYHGSLIFNANKSTFECFCENIERKTIVKGDRVIVTGGVDPNKMFYSSYITYDDSVLLSLGTLERNNTVDSFLVVDKIGIIKWSLENETRKIGNFVCNKATTTFRGRDFIAWYTYDIPFSVGPWKFNGLPGLILDVYDTDFKYQFTASKIIIPCVDAKFDSIPNGVSISLEKFVKLEIVNSERRRKQLLRSYQALMPRGAEISTFKVDKNRIEKVFEFEKQ